MRRIYILSAIICFSAIQIFAQEDGTLPPSASSANNKSLPKKTFSVNPLGLLQFGPIIQGELQLGNGPVYLSPHFRYQYLGLATHIFFAASDFTYVAPDNFGTGLSLRVLFDNENNPHVGYFGAGVEYNQSTTRRNPNDPVLEEEEYFQGLAFIANGGYRWRNHSGRFIGLGINVGVNTTLKDHLYFTATPNDITEFDNTLFVAFLDLSFGWEKN